MDAHATAAPPTPALLELGHDLLAGCRASGDSSKFHGTFRPGGPRLIFGL